MNPSPASQPFGIAWLRPEYRDRDEELVTVSEIAEIAGVSPRTVSAWRERHDHFPQLAKEEYSAQERARFFVAVEVVRWLLEHRPTRRDSEPERLRETMRALDGEIAAKALQLSHLRSVRGQIHEALASTATAEAQPEEVQVASPSPRPEDGSKKRTAEAEPGAGRSFSWSWDRRGDPV